MDFAVIVNHIVKIKERMINKCLDRARELKMLQKRKLMVIPLSATMELLLMVRKSKLENWI